MKISLNPKTVGVVGAVLLLVGSFMPFAGVPLFGSVSYIQGGTGDGVIVVGLAILSFFFVIKERYKALWWPSIAAASLVTFSIVSVFTGAGDSNFISLQLGPLVIYLGAALLGWAAKSAPASDRPGPSRIKLFSQGSRISSLLVVLGAALIASTPIIVTALNLSPSGESFGFLLILWFYVGGLDSFAVLLAPLIGLFIFVRGYPFWSWIGPLYAVSASLSAGSLFFDAFPGLSILPALVGAVIYGIGAIVARRRAGKNRVTEALRDDESSGETL